MKLVVYVVLTKIGSWTKKVGMVALDSVKWACHLQPQCQIMDLKSIIKTSLIKWEIIQYLGR